MSRDWMGFVEAAFVAALALFTFFFYQFADFSSTSAGIESIEHFLLAITYSIAPSGLSLWIDLAAATLTGVVSLNVVKENVLIGLFLALFMYFFLSILGNYAMIIS